MVGLDGTRSSSQCLTCSIRRFEGLRSLPMVRTCCPASYWATKRARQGIGLLSNGTWRLSCQPALTSHAHLLVAFAEACCWLPCCNSHRPALCTEGGGQQEGCQATNGKDHPAVQFQACPSAGLPVCPCCGLCAGGPEGGCAGARQRGHPHECPEWLLPKLLEAPEPCSRRHRGALRVRIISCNV